MIEIIKSDTIKEYVSYSQDDLIRITKDANELYQGFYSNFLVLGSIAFAIVAILVPIIINFINRKSARKLKKEVKNTKIDLEKRKLELEEINTNLIEKENNLKKLINAHTLYSLSHSVKNDSKIWSVIYYLDYLCMLFEADKEKFKEIIQGSKVDITFTLLTNKDFNSEQLLEFTLLNDQTKKLNDLKKELDVEQHKSIDEVTEKILKYIKLFEDRTKLKV